MDEAAKKVASVKDMAHDSALRGFDMVFPRSRQAARGASRAYFALAMEWWLWRALRSFPSRSL
jgi:hypothetical protein